MEPVWKRLIIQLWWIRFLRGGMKKTSSSAHGVCKYLECLYIRIESQLRLTSRCSEIWSARSCDLLPTQRGLCTCIYYNALLIFACSRGERDEHTLGVLRRRLSIYCFASRAPLAEPAARPSAAQLADYTRRESVSPEFQCTEPRLPAQNSARECRWSAHMDFARCARVWGRDYL